MNELFLSIRRTPYQSLSAFLVLFLITFLSTAILFSLAFLYGLLGYVEAKPQVTVYFQNQTSQDDIFTIKDALVSSGKILSVKYISKQEAFSIYKQLNKDNPLLLEMVSADILPASLEIYAKKPAYLTEIAEFLKTQKGIDEVLFQKVFIDRLLTLTSIVRKASLSFFSYLIVTAVFVLITITHFKVALKKEEIELLKLLGASNSYVQKPFLAEGAIFGFSSSIAAFSIFAGILIYTKPFFTSYFREIASLSVSFNSYQLTVWPFTWEFFGALFLSAVFFGIAVSISAAFFATQKYIK